MLGGSDDKNFINKPSVAVHKVEDRSIKPIFFIYFLGNLDIPLTVSFSLVDQLWSHHGTTVSKRRRDWGETIRIQLSPKPFSTTPPSLRIHSSSRTLKKDFLEGQASTLNFRCVHCYSRLSTFPDNRLLILTTYCGFVQPGCGYSEGIFFGRGGGRLLKYKYRRILL